MSMSGHGTSIPPEILDAVRRIEIRTRRLVQEVFSGEYHSVFKGTGMEFREVREYVPGDDVRTIDWNVTARTGDPFVKLFEEERELTVVLAVDILPAELPREASEEFSRALQPFVPAMANADYSVPFDDLELPPEILRAVIVHRGELAPDFRYLTEHLRDSSK